jgi:hypothetical protein
MKFDSVDSLYNPSNDLINQIHNQNTELEEESDTE